MNQPLAAPTHHTSTENLDQARATLTQVAASFRKMESSGALGDGLRDLAAGSAKKTAWSGVISKTLDGITVAANLGLKELEKVLDELLGLAITIKDSVRGMGEAFAEQVRASSSDPDEMLRLIFATAGVGSMAVRARGAMQRAATLIESWLIQNLEPNPEAPPSDPEPLSLRLQAGRLLRQVRELFGHLVHSSRPPQPKAS